MKTDLEKILTTLSLILLILLVTSYYVCKNIEKTSYNRGFNRGYMKAEINCELSKINVKDFKLSEFDNRYHPKVLLRTDKP